MTKLENALIWLYVKTWGKFGDHLLQEKTLWNFGAEDLEAAITGLTFLRKKGKTERAKALTDSIMERFEQDIIALREWLMEIHEEIIETLEETVELDAAVDKVMISPQEPRVIKILSWDQGIYLMLRNTGFFCYTALGRIHFDQIQDMNFSFKHRHMDLL